MSHLSNRLIGTGIVLASALAAQPAFAASVHASFAAGEAAVVERALQVPVGQSLRLAGVPLGGDTPATLVLERFEVFTPDARIVVHDGAEERTLPAPARAYFRGEVASDPASVAFLALDENGGVKGLVSRQGELHWLGREDGGPAELGTRRVETANGELGEAFTCGAESLGHPAGATPLALFAPSSPGPLTAAAITPLYTADIAIETDYEFYQLFGNAATAAGYVGDLMGAISAIYYRDIGVTLKVNHLSLWSSSGDPWTGTSLSGLCELGTWWHANRPPTSYPRATVQFLSGKPSGSGVAWLGVLCRGDFGAASYGCGSGQYGGGYSFISGLRGAFSLTNASFFWDIAGTAHEIGHNFSSPHTHCYNNIPTAGQPPVDQCYNAEAGCYGGTTVSVPGGGGSIMSYCQLRSGGFSNVNLAFGQAGLYGDHSERVTARLRQYVTAQSCLAFSPARPADFNGDGRSDLTIYRGGAWLEYNLWPGN